MPTVEWWMASGGVLGGDRRFRVQGISLVADEELRKVRLRGTFVTALNGDSSLFPTNLSELAIGVAFGPDPSTPPAGDPRSNPSGSTWLGAWHSNTEVQPRSVDAAAAGYDLRMSLGHNNEVTVPRPANGTQTSIWAVTSPLPVVQAGTIEWIGTLSLDYYSFRP